MGKNRIKPNGVTYSAAALPVICVIAIRFETRCAPSR